MPSLWLQPLPESLLHIVLSLAIGMSYIAHPARRLCAALMVLWLLLTILIPSGGRSWRIGLALILLLNLRGVILSDGPQPVSHMDYILIIIAFLTALRPGAYRYWARFLTVCSWSIGIGAALSLPKLIQAIALQTLSFRLGFLSINQTALLAGIGICSAIACILSANNRIARLASIVPLILCILLALGTHSRAAIGFIPISAVLALMLFWAGLLRKYQTTCLSIIPRLLAFVFSISTVVTILILAHGLPTADQIRVFYGDENYMNDRGRAAVYVCYAAAPLTGENHLLYGVGYGNSSKDYCDMRKIIGRHLTHAHNLFLQVWAETGLIPGLALIFCTAHVGRSLYIDQISVWRRSRSAFCIEARTRIAYNLVIIYPILFSLVELGMLKVPMLTMIFGHLMGLGLQKVQPINSSPQPIEEALTS